MYIGALMTKPLLKSEKKKKKMQSTARTSHNNGTSHIVRGNQIEKNHGSAGEIKISASLANLTTPEYYPVNIVKTEQTVTSLAPGGHRAQLLIF